MSLWVDPKEKPHSSDDSEVVIGNSHPFPHPRSRACQTEDNSLEPALEENRFLSEEPDPIPAFLRLNFLQINGLSTLADRVPILSLQAIHLVAALKHLIIALASELTESKSLPLKSECLELRRHGDKLEDLLHQLNSSGSTSKSLVKIQELQIQLNEIFLLLCSERPGADVVLKSKPTFAVLKEVDWRRIEMTIEPKSHDVTPGAHELIQTSIGDQLHSLEFNTVQLKPGPENQRTPPVHSEAASSHGVIFAAPPSKQGGSSQPPSSSVEHKTSSRKEGEQELNSTQWTHIYSQRGRLPEKNAHVYISTRPATHPSFTLVSNHPISYHGALYPTAEHLYHAFKFFDHEPEIAELVRRSPDPKALAHRYDDRKRNDWQQQHLHYMERTMLLKFNSYPGLMRDLLNTGEAQLILLGSDRYWARQESGTGDNEFGKVLMRVRASLRGGH